jgi:hypothetical protein
MIVGEKRTRPVHVFKALGILFGICFCLGFIFAEPWKSKAEHLQDECNKAYGKATEQSQDCVIKLGLRMLNEQQRDTMNGIYQKVR